MAINNSESRVTFKVFNQDFNKSLKEMKAESSKLRQEFDLQQEQLKLNGTEAQQLASKMDYLQKSQVIAGQRITNTIEQLRKAKEMYGENSKEVDQLERQLRSAQIAEQKIANQITQTNQKLEEQSKTAEKVTKSLQETGEKLKNVGSVATATVTPAMGAIGFASLKAAANVDNAQGQIQAQLGLTEGEAKKLEKTAISIWKKGFGENLGEVTNNLALVKQNIQNISDEALPKVTEQALVLQKTFGAEVNESTRTASVMMKNFGIDATTAMDLMTVGFQKGGNFSDELLDTLREYSPQFSTMGHSATDMMNILISGAKSGAFNLDKVGDAVKEFNIRAKDGSKTSAEGFKAIGLNAKQMGEAIAKGGDSGKQAFQATIAALAGIEDPLKRNQAGVALFGTQWEDLESDVIKAMASSTNHVKGFEGSTDRAGDALKKSFGMELSATLRELQLSLLPLGNVMLDFVRSILPAVKNGAQLVANAFSNLTPFGQNLVIIFGLVATAMGPLLTALGFMVTGISGLVGPFSTMFGWLTKLKPVFDTLRIAMMALTGPVGLIVAAIVGFIAVFVALYKTNEDFRNKVIAIWSTIKQMYYTSLNYIKNIVQSVMSSVMAFFVDILNKIKAFWKANGAQIKAIVTADMNTILATIKIVLGLIKGVFQIVLPVITGLIKIAWNLIKLTVKIGMDLILGIIQTTMKILQGDWKGAWQSIKQTVINIWNNIKGFFKSVNLVQIGKDIINGLVKGIGSMRSAIKDKVESMASELPTWMKKILGIHSPSRVMATEVGQHIPTGVAKGMDSKKGVVKDSAKKIAAEAKKGFDTEFKNIDLKFDAKKISATEAIKQLEQLKDKYKSVPNAVAKVNKEIYDINQKHAKALEELRKAQFEKEKSFIEGKKYFNQLSLTQELTMLQKNMAHYKKGSEERQYYEREVYRVKQEINEKIITINEQYTAKMSEINQKLIDDEKRLTDEYNNAVSERTKSLYSFKGLFDEVSLNSEISGQQLVSNLQGQIDTFKNWQKNIEELSNKKLDIGLLDELRAMGPNAAAEIAALNTLSTTDLQNYTNLWKEKNTLARTEAEAELEGMKLDTQTKITELRTQSQIELEKYKTEWITKIKEIRQGTTSQLNMKDSMKTIGTNTIQGLMEGMDSMIGPLMKQAQSIANAVSGTIKKALDIHSPSRVLEWMGKMVGSGLIKGMDFSVDGIKGMAQKMADSAIPQFSPRNNAPSSTLQGQGGTKIEQHLTINSPTPLSPSETARQNQMVLQQLAFQFRG